MIPGSFDFSSVTNFNPNAPMKMLQGHIKANATESTNDNASHNSIEGFGKLLKNEMEKVNALQNQANQATETYASGGNIPLHSVMIALEKADTATQMAVQVRNRLVSAYQDISRMQL